MSIKKHGDFGYLLDEYVVRTGFSLVIYCPRIAYVTQFQHHLFQPLIWHPHELQGRE